MVESVGIEEVVATTLASVLEDEDGVSLPYHPDNITTWTNDCISLICETVMETKRALKCICHVVICQSTGAGLHAASGAVWDNIHDSSTTVKYSNDSVNVITTVFLIADPHPPAFDIPAPTSGN